MEEVCPEMLRDPSALALAWGEIAEERSFPAKVRAAAAIKKMECLTGENLAHLLDLLTGKKRGGVPDPLSLGERIERIIRCQARPGRPGATRSEIQRCIRGVTGDNFDAVIAPLVTAGKVRPVDYKPPSGPAATLYTLADERGQ